MIKFTWKWKAPKPPVFTNKDLITQTALRVLENHLSVPKTHNNPTAFPGLSAPTRWERIKWRVGGYFSNLWSAICGRRYDH